MNPNQKTVDECKTFLKQLKYEGKATHEQVEWFGKEYIRHQVQNGNKQRHKEQESPALQIKDAYGISG